VCIHEDSLPLIPFGVFNFISADGSLGYVWLYFPGYKVGKIYPIFHLGGLAYRYNISKAVVLVAHLPLTAKCGEQKHVNEYFI
jgi:hypothetical protein